MDSKQCSKCGETKEVSEFYRHARDGRRSDCKACCRESSRKYRRDNPEAKSEQGQRHYRDRSKYYRDYMSQWRRDNPGAVAVQKHRRRARKLAAEGSYTAQDWADRLAFFGHRCLYCGTKDNLTVDHMTPLSRGGSNFPQNLAPACQSCNSSKGAKTVEEYLDTLS